MIEITEFPNSFALRLFVLLCGVLFTHNSIAVLSEPQAVYYGEVIVSNQRLSSSDSHFSVVAKQQDGTLLDQFTMGTNPIGLDDQYILRLPMDSVGSRKDGHVRENDSVEFYAVSDSGETLLASITVGGRGTINQLKLGMVDVDNDTVDDDVDNCLLVTNTDQANMDSDAAGDLCDDFPTNSAEVKDSDSDGMGDNFESTYGFNPLDASDAALDSDNDGISNIDEFLAGTDPRGTVPVNADQSEDIPLPAWALMLMMLIMGRLGYRRKSA